MHQAFNYINIHTHHIDQETDEISIFNLDLRTMPLMQESEKYYSIALHPWYVTGNTNKYMQQVYEYANKKNILAIGETGIDRTVNIPLSLQEQIFTEHIRIAEKVSKPIIIHCVRGFYEILAIYKRLQPKINFIFHGYNNNLHIAKQLLAVDRFYFSFGKALMHPNSNAQMALLQTPVNKLFLETDDASITISAIFAQAAQLKQCSVMELKRQITLNFNRIFLNE